MIARSAGYLVAAKAAASHAATAVDEHGFGVPEAQVAVAVAKIQAGRAAVAVSRRTSGTRRDRLHPRPPAASLHYPHARLEPRLRRPLGVGTGTGVGVPGLGCRWGVRDHSLTPSAHRVSGLLAWRLRCEESR